MPNLTARRLLALAGLFFAVSSARAEVRHVALPQPDVTALLRIAQIKVNSTSGFSRAVLRTATGTVSGGGNATTAQDINTWVFVYDNSPTPKAAHPSATLAYAANAFGKVTPGSTLGLGLGDIRSLPVMTLAHAVQLLHKAAITTPFTSVVLRSVPGPAGNDPYYAFTLANGKGTSVNTVTGTVIPPVEIDPP
jgi:hypothetical protein